nr:hypothetical protein [Tanacetum cinerariifolium]
QEEDEEQGLRFL